MEESCTVGFVDRRELPLGRWATLLSTREQSEAEARRHPERRERALTSRVLTKYLLMQHDEMVFRQLNAKEIESLPTEEWSSIELLAGTTVTKAGTPAPNVSVSSSHCGTYTASCVGKNQVGLDLERIEPRRPEFYTGAFSAEERDWAGRTCKGGAPIEALFTILWTVKEAYLKASTSRKLSIWSFPNWTVWCDGSTVDHLWLKPPGEFVRSEGGIRGRDFSTTFQIATMRIYDMVLTTIQYERADEFGNHCTGSVR